MKNIKLLPLVGQFAENKDLAKKIRTEQLIPLLEKKKKITLDFSGISATTQSFIHALLSDLIRKYDAELFDFVIFKGCSENVKQIINIVVDYMMESE